MRKLIVLAGVFILAACGSQSEQGWDYTEASEGGFLSKFSEAEYAAEELEADESIAANADMGLTGQQVNPDRKMIWTGSLDFQVDNIDEATKHITALAQQHQGFVSGMNLYTSNYEISNNITLRVKSEHFFQLLESLQKASVHTRSVQINSNDVSEEFVDINSRLKTKREVRERFITVLNTKTGNVADILEAERSIGKITEEIEALEGRLRYLSDQVSLSTINVRIYQKVDYVKEPTVYHKSFFDKITDALSWGWEAIKAVLLVIITLWPLWLIGGGVWFYIRRRRNRKKESQNS
jgi:hypothetical protein